MESDKRFYKAITALRSRLAQPEQELVIDCPRCGHCCPQQPAQQHLRERAKQGDLFEGEA